VAPGEWVNIVGANGAGRSTLLKTILGAGTTVTAGDVIFEDQRVTNLSSHRRVAAGISMSPEGRRIFANLSVKENLRSGAHNLSKKDMAAQLEQVYGVFPKLETRSDQRAGSLSGGEQQMVAIGRALMSRPKLLLVDELSLGLAPIIVASLKEALRTLCQQGLGVIVVDEVHIHDDESDAMARRLVLEKGRFVTDLDLEAEQTLFATTTTAKE
jgi:branched-chain amino acid transport system ATP-binding protein